MFVNGGLEQQITAGWGGGAVQEAHLLVQQGVGVGVGDLKVDTSKEAIRGGGREW